MRALAFQRVGRPLARAANVPVLAPFNIALAGDLVRGATLTLTGGRGLAGQLEYRDSPTSPWVALGAPAASFTLDSNHSGRELQVRVGAVTSPVIGPIAISDLGNGPAAYYGGGRVVVVVNTGGAGQAAAQNLVASQDYETRASFYRGHMPGGKVRVSKRFKPGYGAKVWNYSAVILGHHEDTVNPLNPYTPLPAGRVGRMTTRLSSFTHISGPGAFQPLEEMFVWSQANHIGTGYRDVCTGEIGVFYYVPAATLAYFNGPDCVQCGTWTDDKGRTFQMIVTPGPYQNQPFRIPFMVAIPAAGANVAVWDQGGQDKPGLVAFWMERGWINPEHLITGHSFGIEGLSHATQDVADVVEFEWDIDPADWAISTGGVKIVPDTLNSFYVMQKTSRGTAMAYRFIQGSGDAAGAASIGNSYQRFRPVLIAEFASFAADPKGAFGTRLRTYMDSVGATDYAFRRTGGSAFMASFHGGETATSAPVFTLDGNVIDITQAATGDAFEMTQNTSVTDGTATVTIANSRHRIVSGAAEMRFDPGTVNGGATVFSRAYIGMGIATGAGWTEASMLRHGGGMKRIAIPNTIGPVKGLGMTYVYQARDLAMHHPASGMVWRIVSNAPTIAGYRDSSLMREGPSGDGSAPARPDRAKIYTDFGGTAFGTKSGMMCVYRFELVEPGAAAFDINRASDPGFAGGPPTAAGGAGPWFKSDNAGGSVAFTGGVARFTRANDGAGDERLWQPVATAIDSVWLFGMEQVALLAGSPAPALAAGLNANGSVLSPAATADRNYDTGGGFVGHVFVATASTTYLHARLPSGSGTAQQVADLDNAVAMRLAMAA